MIVSISEEVLVVPVIISERMSRRKLFMMLLLDDEILRQILKLQLVISGLSDCCVATVGRSQELGF